jgi:hypothetical protein
LNTTLSLSLESEIVIELPNLPNFIKVKEPTEFMLDVKDISAHSLVRIARAWEIALLEHSSKRKNDEMKAGAKESTAIATLG